MSLFPAALARQMRDAPWANRERLRGYLVLLALANAIGVAALALQAGHGVDARGEPIGSDFVSFWTAGRLALAGRAAAVYAPAAHHAAEQAMFGHPIGWYAFFYPPTFLLLCAPFGLFSYLAALLVWLSAGFAAFVAALRALSRRFVNPLTVAAFPGLFVTVGHGQNALLTTTLFAGGAALLERRPALAGVLLGALSFKPQLAAIAPLALLLSGRWRALAGFAATAAALAALSLALFGADAWRAFAAETPLTRATLDDGLVDFAKMASVYAAARGLGAGAALAYAAQAAAALAALALLAWALRRERDARRQLALAAVATTLTTPFLLDYDLTLLILPIAVLAEDGLAEGFLSFEKTVLVAAYLLPGLARPLAQYGRLPIAPLVLAALAAVLARRAVCGRPGLAA